MTLINSSTNTEIKQLIDGDTINLHYTGSSLSIRANVSETVGSVVFGYDDNDSYQTESIAPYAIAGDDQGDYNAWTPSIGGHTISATRLFRSQWRRNCRHKV